MSSNTEFDWLDTEICDIKILNYMLQIFWVRYSCVAPIVNKVQNWPYDTLSLTGGNFKVSGYFRE